MSAFCIHAFYGPMKMSSLVMNRGVTPESLHDAVACMESFKITDKRAFGAHSPDKSTLFFIRQCEEWISYDGWTFKCCWEWGWHCEIWHISCILGYYTISTWGNSLKNVSCISNALHISIKPKQLCSLSLCHNMSQNLPLLHDYWPPIWLSYLFFSWHTLLAVCIISWGIDTVTKLNKVT